MTHLMPNTGIMKKRSIIGTGSRKDAIFGGFLRGFSAPAFFFASHSIDVPSQYNTSVEKAWSDVGRTMRVVIERETSGVDGKNTGQTNRKRRVAA